MTDVQQRNITKVLIANRGEIAMRIIRACRDLGIGTVGVYSDVDRTALHVRYADEAVHIGPPQPRDSYLRMDKIIEAARRTGADAIHPGYGFLAENADFAQQVTDEGLIFIGPGPAAISQMGDKQSAREAVRRNGVPLIPGTEAGLHDDDVIAAAEKIGFPVMVKAVAGGGGKGMRVVNDLESLPNAL
ncbi:MAG: acetyl-CoA carboxylase biotin carboxylase subunit, partial [Planctomycetales bacterium]|nr:acetyl-CoA carboxylase biotin carboxylase subunit [Planctomycetales bacterium]